MFSVAHLLDSAKAKAAIESDYRLAKVIGISHNVISGYRSGKSLPNEAILGQLCALSGDDPGLIAAQIQAARSKTPEARSLWLMVAARMAGRVQTAFLSVLIAIALIAGYAVPAKASESHDAKTGAVNLLYIVSITFLSVGEFLRSRLRWFYALRFVWVLHLPG